MNSTAGFRFRFESLIRKFEREVRFAEIALGNCCANVARTNADIVQWQQTNQQLAENWNSSIQAGSLSSIDSRLVFAGNRQKLERLQQQLQAEKMDVEKNRAELIAITQRLRSIELIREQDLLLFKRGMKKKYDRDILEMILRKETAGRSEVQRNSQSSREI